MQLLDLLVQDRDQDSMFYHSISPCSIAITII